MSLKWLHVCSSLEWVSATCLFLSGSISANQSCLLSFCCASAKVLQPVVSSACVYACPRQSTKGVKLGISTAVNHPRDGEWRDDTRSHSDQSSYTYTLSLRLTLARIMSRQLMLTVVPCGESVCCKHCYGHLNTLTFTCGSIFTSEQDHFLPWKHIFNVQK